MKIGINSHTCCRMSSNCCVKSIVGFFDKISIAVDLILQSKSKYLHGLFTNQLQLWLHREKLSLVLWSECQLASKTAANRMNVKCVTVTLKVWLLEWTFITKQLNTYSCFSTRIKKTNGTTNTKYDCVTKYWLELGLSLSPSLNELYCYDFVAWVVSVEEKQSMPMKRMSAKMKEIYF